jgi:hypothetical protein
MNSILTYDTTANTWQMTVWNSFNLLAIKTYIFINF